MRFVYLDEAGSSFEDPVTIVAGVIVHADTQWKAAAAAIVKLAEEVPAEYREGFNFHGKEIIGGGKMPGPRDIFGKPTGPKKELDDNIWPFSARRALWKRLLAVPKEQGLVVVLGVGKKHPPEEQYEPKVEILLRHSVVFMLCIREANERIKVMFPGEVATVVAEDTPDMRRYLRSTPQLLKAADAPFEMRENTEFDAVVDTVHFTEKHNAPLLQIADAVAYSVRRYLSGYSHGEDMMRELLGQQDVPKLLGAVMGAASRGGHMTIAWPKPRPASPTSGERPFLNI